MRWALLLLAFLTIPFRTAYGADFTATPTETLIGELAQLDSETPGADQTGWYESFMGEDGAPSMEVGLLGHAPPIVPPVMRELVRRGVAALPALLHHLEDGRSTKLTVGEARQQFFGGQFFRMEYDPRIRRTETAKCDDSCGFSRRFETTYDVKVGDLCFVLIGQIVDRNLVAVRYQPTAILIVNSPIQSPELARRVRQDWNGLTAEQHRASLLADIHTARDVWAARPALVRLRFYYPDAYSALGGRDAELRAEFEAEERKKADRR